MAQRGLPAEVAASATPPLLSVIIPTFNRQATILEAVSSVLNQTLHQVELVVVDDGSTDETVALLSAVDDPRLVVVATDRRGANGARHLGVQASTARLVTFLDSDDVALPQWAERIVWLLDHADVASCGNWSESIGEPAARQYPSPFNPFFPEIVASFRHGGTYALTRDLYDEVGGLAEDLRSSQHTELGIRIGKYSHGGNLVFASTSEPLIIYRIGSDGSIRKQWDALADGSRYILEAHSDLYDRFPKVRAEATYRLGVRLRKSGDHRASRKAFAESFRARPTAHAVGRYCQSGLQHMWIRVRRRS